MSDDTAIRLLFLEDNSSDYKLCLLELRAARMTVEASRTATKEEFWTALAKSPPDVVLADYNLPGWSGLDALHLMRSMQISIPFIVVTGSLGDEVAAECIKQGATDYVVKDRLARLPVAIRKAMDQKRNREALRRSEVRYESLVQHAPIGIFRLSATEDRFIAVNPALVNILGYDSAEELLKVRVSQDVYLTSKDREKVLERAALLDSYLGLETQWKRKDGTPITARLSGRVIREGSEAVAYEVFAEDVTDYHSLENQLLQAQKMEAVGRLAGGIAHDFNNLLTVVIAYAEMTKQRSPDARVSGYAEKILIAGNKASSLTRQLLAFSRKQILDPVVLDLNDLLAELGKLLPRLIGEDIELVFAPDPELGLIKADPSQVEQVIMNLVVNSRDAMPQGGKLTIETKNVDLDLAYSRIHFEAAPGSYVMLAVSDTGIGMSAETKARIFEPFFTTKEAGKGTGLGLATVYGIVKQSGGSIWVYSEPLKGTTVKIYLRRVSGKAEPIAAIESEPATGSGVVLVVEDEPEVRLVVKEMLQDLGYTALESGSDDDTLRLMEKQKRIDVLLVDLIMPGIRGPEVAARLKKSHPETRVIYMSGYSDRASQVQDLGLEALFLQKPFSVAVLSQKIKKALEPRS